MTNVDEIYGYEGLDHEQLMKNLEEKKPPTVRGRKLLNRLNKAWRRVANSEVEYSWKGAKTEEEHDAIVEERRNAMIALQQVLAEFKKFLNEAYAPTTIIFPVSRITPNTRALLEQLKEEAEKE